MIEPHSSIANPDYKWWQDVGDMSPCHEFSPLIVYLDPMHEPLVGTELTCGGREERVCFVGTRELRAAECFAVLWLITDQTLLASAALVVGPMGGLGGAVPSKPPLKPCR